jgi:hypothetical protein
VTLRRRKRKGIFLGSKMKRLNFFLIAFASCLAALYNYGWSTDEANPNPSAESMIAFKTAVAFFVLDCVGWLAWEFFNKDRLEARRKKREVDFAKKHEICKEVTLVLDHELANIEQLAERISGAKTGYNSVAHRLAVEQKSFEKILVAIEQLGEWREFRKLTASIATEATRNLTPGHPKDVSRIDPLVRELMAKIQPCLEVVA